MRKIAVHRGDYDIERALEKAKTRLEYHEEKLHLFVARQISNAMHAQGMSRSELAQKMNVTPPYITKLLRGHENLSLQSLARIGRALNSRWKVLLSKEDLQASADTD